MFTALILSGCSQLSDETFCYLFQTLDSEEDNKSRKSLNLQELKKMESINLGEFKEKVQGISLLCLRNLDLDGCVKLTNYSFVSIMFHCPNIQLLILETSHVNDEALESSSKYLSVLQELSLSSLDLSDSSLNILIKHCTSLRMLTLRNIPGITPKGLLSLFRLPLLKFVYLSKMENISKNSFVLPFKDKYIYFLDD